MLNSFIPEIYGSAPGSTKARHCPGYLGYAYLGFRYVGNQFAGMVTGVAIGFETANGASFDAIIARFGIDRDRNFSKSLIISLRLALLA